jgi:hypothetical protein
MKTYPLKNEDGEQVGFEFENGCITVGRIAQLLSSIEGVAKMDFGGLFRR